MAPSPKKDTGLCGVYWESPPNPRRRDTNYAESRKANTSGDSSSSPEAESTIKVSSRRSASAQSDLAMGPIKDNGKFNSF